MKKGLHIMSNAKGSGLRRINLHKRHQELSSVEERYGCACGEIAGILSI